MRCLLIVWGTVVVVRRFRDRVDAGRQLAEQVLPLAGSPSPPRERRRARPRLVNPAETVHDAASSTGVHYKWIALSNITLGILMVTINQSILLISLPDLFRGIKLNPLTPSNTSYFLWIPVGFLLVTAGPVIGYSAPAAPPARLPPNAFLALDCPSTPLASGDSMDASS